MKVARQRLKVLPVDDMTESGPVTFREFGLSKSLMRALNESEYKLPTPIQIAAIPPILEGRDVLGCAQTGSGKTAAFALPVIQNLTNSPQPPQNQVRKVRCLVLTPTRELAAQIGESFRVYGAHCPLKHALVFGGVDQGRQVKSLRPGVDILVATPGRLRDLLEQEHVTLSQVEVLILDEADRMLDMGFLPEVQELINELPTARQTLLFSATIPREIRDFSDSILRDPVEITIHPEKKTVDTVEQSVYFVEKARKQRLLHHVLSTRPITQVLVFVRMKHQADKVVHQLQKRGMKATALHSDKTQLMREKALADFKALRCQILVATDIAARGIDVDDISHVINFDLPTDVESYVHRIGRTARIGKMGAAITFCDVAERDMLRSIQKFIRQELLEEIDHPDYGASIPLAGNADPDEEDVDDEASDATTDSENPGETGEKPLNRQQRKWRAQARRREAGEVPGAPPAPPPREKTFRPEQQGKKRLGRKGRN